MIHAANARAEIGPFDPDPSCVGAQQTRRHPDHHRLACTVRTDQAEDADDTVAFWLPDRAAQIMLSTTPQPAGPMYLVDSVDTWVRDHPGIVTAVEKFDIPGGSVAGFAAPGGNTFYVFDQPDE